jgi:hypothetical protein
VHNGDRVVVDAEDGKMKFVPGRRLSHRKEVDDSPTSSAPPHDRCCT